MAVVSPVRSSAIISPNPSSRRRPTGSTRATDFALYCERTVVERFFNKIKHYRGIATRFDKLARTFLAGVMLVSVLV